MAKRKVHHKKTTHRHTAKKSWLQEATDSKHRPLHAAGIGTLMVFLQGVFEVIGILLIVGAALTYVFRAYRSSSR